jgi:hypothetical protein
MKEIIIVCDQCGSSDIEQLEWHKVNTNEYAGEGCGEINDQWCCICEENVEFCTEEEYKNSKLNN